MRWYEALSDICIGANDPDLKLFENAKPHFLVALASMIKADDYTLEDIFGLHKFSNLTFVAGIEDVSALKIEKVIDVYYNVSYGSPAEKSVKFFANLKEINTLSAATTTQPGPDDIWLYKIGGNIYCATEATPTGIVLQYIEYPDDSSWDDNETTGTIISDTYTIPFIKKAVLMAIQGLVIEDQDFKG